MGRTVGEIWDDLATAENYWDARKNVSGQMIDFIRNTMPRDWERIKEKEEAFQNMIEMLPNG